MTDSPFRITVYDKTMKRMGTIGDPTLVVATPRHNAQPTAALTIRSDHHRLSDLAAKGARVRLDYLDQFLMSGRVRLRQGSGPKLEGSVTFQVADDWRLLTRVRGWPNPAGTIDQQGADFREHIRTGTAEAVVRAFVQANAIDRLGMPVTLGTNGNRGANIRVTMRFHPLADRLLPKIDEAGIGVTVRQSGPLEQGTGFQVDCYAPATYPRDLTEESGVVQKWAWSFADPEVTRVAGGAEGVGTQRPHRQIIDTAREAEYGDLIEGYRDARDIDTTDVGWEADLDGRIQETLTEGAPRAGLSLELSETSTFSYDPSGIKGIRVGDRVKVAVGPGVVVEDVLREATLTWSADDGLNVTPSVGERSDDPTSSLVRAVARLARVVRDQSTR